MHKDLLTEIFPELQESEDERIRKEMVDYFSQYKDGGIRGVDITPWIAYLEKQKEPEPNYCHHKVDLKGCSEEYRKAYYDGWNNCNMQHDQCEAEQKPSLCDKCEKKSTCLDVKYDNSRAVEQCINFVEIEQKPVECGCTNDESEYDKGWRDGHKAGLKDAEMQKPAEWSEEEKGILLECISALQNSSHWLLADKLSSLRPQPKVEWTEEDEKMIKSLIDNFTHYAFTPDGTDARDIIPWLKSLTLKKRLDDVDKLCSNEWSEEDEEAIDMCLDAIPKRWKTKSGILLTEWLKEHLCPSWKPSEEQMKALQNAVALTACDKELARLYNQLKALWKHQR